MISVSWRQTSRQTEEQRQTDRQTDRQTGRETEGPGGSVADWVVQDSDCKETFLDPDPNDDTKSR